ncbi:MAG: iron ABC transporter permease [Blautia sp.]|nr:iron ABC transporter permease [Blautia sp.]
MKKKETFSFQLYIVFLLTMLLTLVLCICVGSVVLPVKDTLQVLQRAITGKPQEELEFAASIILSVRLPRVVCVALIGAALSVSGAAMQGLLKNPLADGSTMGVSSGASLGAVFALAFHVRIPGISGGSTMIFAALGAFLSLLLILTLAYKLDSSLATNSIILIGVIFSMFANSISSLIITFAGERVKTITFWTMGSLQDSSFRNALILSVTLLLCSVILLSKATELNAFAIGEENARNIGVDVKKVKLTLLICISVLIGIAVSVSGTIAFVGLVTPHIVRMLVGANHKRLLPASMFGGAIFLLLCDLAARTILNPRELPVGVITSFIGAVVFVIIFYSSRRR